jgi:hypothetical protein
MVQRIEDNNAARRRGEVGEFGRTIALRVLRAEVPVNYLVNFSRDRLSEAVNRGVETAREWCAGQPRPIDLRAPARATGGPPSATAAVRFTERMRGYMAFGESDARRGYRTGRGLGTSLSATLTIRLDPLGDFITTPQHQGSAEGYIDCQALGGRLPLVRGWVNLLVDRRQVSDPAHKQMLYRLHFRDSTGRPLTLIGVKEVVSRSGSNVWRATTTLFTHIVQGHVLPGEQTGAPLVASGVITIGMGDFLRQLSTIRARGGRRRQNAAALARFAAFFFGRLWDVYASRLLVYAPF